MYTAGSTHISWVYEAKKKEASALSIRTEKVTNAVMFGLAGVVKIF